MAAPQPVGRRASRACLVSLNLRTMIVHVWALSCVFDERESCTPSAPRRDRSDERTQRLPVRHSL